VRDAAPLPVLIFAISLLVTLVIVLWIGRMALDYIERREPMFLGHTLANVLSKAPPEPRLEPEPSHDEMPGADLKAVEARERAMIGPDAWRWVDGSHQFARIPVQQAIDLAVARGLPNTLPATQPSSLPVMPPASAVHGPGGVP
jgi:hypothetical protein